MTTPPPPQAPPPAQFDPHAPHQTRPRLRPVRGFAAEGQGPDGKRIPVLGLADARQVSDRVVFTMPAAQLILPLMDGTRDLGQIVAEVGRGLSREMLEQLVAQLDDAALLEGPPFEKLLATMRAEFDAAENLPPASTAAFVDSLVGTTLGEDSTEEERNAVGAQKLREMLDSFMTKAAETYKSPALTALPKAIVAPHLDYHRGWINYGSCYGRVKGLERPDRVVILGTNHFGMGTGIIGCDKGYETALGVCPVARDVLEGVMARLSPADADKFLAHRYDHEREHSIELHIPWIQHVFGADAKGSFPSVLGVLVHDPAVNNGESYDGSGLGLEPFVRALRETIASLPGRTLIISSADLSHAGPAFGDPHPLGGEGPEATEGRNKVVNHDLQLLDMVVKNKPQELLSSFAWTGNPTRWCSLGNLVATLMAVEPSEVQLLNYSAAMDQQGMTMVSSAAMVLL